MSDLIKVELHGHVDETVSDVIDVTRYVTSAQWGNRLASPWETISVTLDMPADVWPYVLPGELLDASTGERATTTGFWVVIRTPYTETAGIPSHGDGWPAVAWGRVSSIRTGWRVGAKGKGSVTAKPLVLQCESWLSMLARSRVMLTAVETSIPEGHAYDVEGWAEPLLELVRGLDTAAAGELLATFWDGLCRIEVPTSLLGGPEEFRTQVPVVHNRLTCSEFAPMRLPQTTRVPGRNLPDLGKAIPRGSLWSWLLNSFRADESVVEMFPSLEFPYQGPSGQVEPFSEEDGGFEIETPETGAPLPANMTELGRLLGAQPVLIYRLRPTLLRSLDHKAAREIAGPAAGVPVAQEVAEETGETTTFGQDPNRVRDLTAAPFYSWSLDDITEVSGGWNDSDRVNGAYWRSPIIPGFGGFEAHGLVGEPAVLPRDIQRNGLRMRDIDWPFFLQADNGLTSGDASLARRLTGLSDVAFSMLASTDEGFFSRWTIAGNYRPWVRSGHWGEFETPDARGLTGYIEAATNTYTVGPKGAESFRTTVEISRAAFGVLQQPFSVQQRIANRGGFGE